MGWFLVNILLPLIAPVLVFAILKVLPMPQANRDALSFLIPVKDGQLCWAAIAFAASALYEIGTGRSVLGAVFVGYVQGCAVLLLSMASIVAAGGAIFRTQSRKPATVPWARHYSTLLTSIVLVVWAALVRVVVQFGL
ncbi:hypothetical protein ABT364_00775 [Massilia sp. SR12]